MSHIQQKTTAGTAIPTPSTGYANLFIEDTTNLPKVKIPGGTILDLQGPTGSQGVQGPAGLDGGSLNPQNPVATPNVIDDSLSAPPASPIAGQAFLVGPTATGVWTGLEGHLMQYPSTGSTWIDVLGRVVAIGDRLGLMIEHAGTPIGGFTGFDDNLAEITNATPGSYAYTFTAPSNAMTVAINGINSPDAGHAYYYNSTSLSWVEFITGSMGPSGPAGDCNVMSIVTKTSNYTLNGIEHTVLCNGTLTISLPVAIVASVGRVYCIKNIGTGTVTVTANGTETIDGFNSILISGKDDSIQIQTNASNWFII